MRFHCARSASAFLALAMITGSGALGCGDDTPATGTDRDSAQAHGDGGHSGHDAEHEPGHDAAHGGDSDAEDGEPAPCTEAYPDFRAGLSASGDGFTVRLLTIAPEPARQKMDNDWTVELVDPAGAPLAGAVIATADSWMPVHQHGGRKKPAVVALEQPGQYKLDNIDFRMPGPWQVRLDVKTAGSETAERVALQLCVK